MLKSLIFLYDHSTCSKHPTTYMLFGFIGPNFKFKENFGTNYQVCAGRGFWRWKQKGLALSSSYTLLSANMYLRSWIAVAYLSFCSCLGRKRRKTSLTHDVPTPYVPTIITKCYRTLSNHVTCGQKTLMIFRRHKGEKWQTSWEV